MKIGVPTPMNVFAGALARFERLKNSPSRRRDTARPKTPVFLRVLECRYRKFESVGRPAIQTFRAYPGHLYCWGALDAVYPPSNEVAASAATIAAGASISPRRVKATRLGRVSSWRAALNQR